MDKSLDLIRALNLIELEIVSLRNYLFSARAIKYSDQSIQSFIASLQSYLDTQSEEIKSLVSSGANEIHFRKQLRRKHKSLSIISSYLIYVRNAKIQWLPWSVVGAIHDIADVIAPKIEIIVTGTLHMTYRLIPPQLKEQDNSPEADNKPSGTSEGHGGTDEDIPSARPTKLDEYAIIEIPFIHRRNSLFHVLLGHELFHLRSEGFVGGASSEALKTITEKYEPALRRKSDELENALSSSPQEDLFRENLLKRELKNIFQARTIAHDIWRKVLTEFFCDVGCLYYFGPSALFAMADLHQIVGDTRTKTDPSKHHPSFGHRLHVLYDLLTNHKKFKVGLEQLQEQLRQDDLEDYADAFKSRISLIGEQFATEIQPSEFEDENYVIAYTVLLPYLSRLTAGVESCNVNEDECWFSNIKETSHHLARLRQSITSGGYSAENKIVGKAGCYSAISLAAWIHINHKLANSPGLAEFETVTADYLDNCNILFKSIDDAHVIRHYSSY